MRIRERGVLHDAEPGGPRAVAAFPTVTALPDGSLLATYSVGSGKDSDDITLELRRSHDGGRTWGPAERPFSSTVDGVRGSLKVGYLTVLDDRLLCVALWIDREAFPGAPLFDPVTEGCLPMAILVADSTDDGATWSDWRPVPMPDDVGPPSLTSPLLALPSGRLAVSVETNKAYRATGPWFQRVVYAWSSDLGGSWTPVTTICADPSGRIANWDQRTAVAPDGRLVSFTWTYDFETASYRNITRRTSADEGVTWSEPDDLGFADQPSRPAILPDGRVVLAWVDRFGSHAIRARLAPAIDGPFDPVSEVVLFDAAGAGSVAAGTDADATETGELLVEMSAWNYGLPYAEALPDGNVLVVHYGPRPGGTGIAWVRLEL